MSNKMWIWQDDRLKSEKEIIRFRKIFDVRKLPEVLIIHVSADTRYILEVNGIRACIGPCKSNKYIRYYETIDISKFLTGGINVITACVIHYPEDVHGAKHFETGSMSMLGTSRGGFALLEPGDEFNISTNSSWKCAEDASYTFVPASEAILAGDLEAVDGRFDRISWKNSDFDDTCWKHAVEVEDFNVSNLYGCLNCRVLEPRPIPMLYEKPKQFKSAKLEPVPLAILHDKEGLTVPAGSCQSLILDAGEFQTGYPSVSMEGGYGSEVEILYAESYYTGYSDGQRPKKGLRNDAENGFLHGEIDKYIAGNGRQVYEPFFFRSFRYVKVTVTTKQNALKLLDISFRETGYPLELQASFESDDQRDQKMWDIGIRTLKRCMHETYEDCPFYEQLQYVMDSRLEALFTYYVSGDSRLASKAISDFLSTQMPNGLTACNSPAKFVQVIPGFSLQIIMMVKEYYLYTGEKNEIRKWLPKLESILNYFLDKIDAAAGLVADIGYWQFTDWVDAWMEGWGACVKPEDRYNYLYNMMLASALEDYAFLCAELGRKDTSDEMMGIKASILRSLQKYAFDGANSLYRYKEGDHPFSQHAQIWAVLCGLAQGEEAVRVMEACINNPSMLKCSYSFSFFLFRALDKTGLYNRYKEMWKDWYDLMKLCVTTWPEDPVTQRSECHGWSALQLYEFPACILGITPGKVGYETLRMEPHIAGRKYAAGKVVTCRGVVEVSWNISDSIFSIKAKLPSVMDIVLILPDGSKKELFTDAIDETCSVIHA